MAQDSAESADQQPSAVRVALRHYAKKVPGLYAFCRLVLVTIRICMKYRVTGLASEAGFFALLSFPPLVYGLLGMVGYVGQAAGGRTVNDVIASIEGSMRSVLSTDALQNVLMPTLENALHAGRPDVISVGFVLSLWSGSRMLNVLIDTISIMYGQGGVRGIIRTRVMSLSLYFVALIFMGVVLPLIVMGPDLIGKLMPTGLLFLMSLYWPVVGALTMVAFATLYYLATPNRTPWIRDLPGAAFALVAWVVISLFLRNWLTASIVGGISIYGPLAATIIVLIWLYMLSIAVLIGAAVNAAVAQLWPGRTTTAGVRARTMELVVDQVAKVRTRPVIRSSQRPYDQMDPDSHGARHARSGRPDDPAEEFVKAHQEALCVDGTHTPEGSETASSDAITQQTDEERSA